MITRLRKYTTIGGWVFYVKVEEYTHYCLYHARTIDPRNNKVFKCEQRISKDILLSRMVDGDPITYVLDNIFCPMVEMIWRDKKEELYAAL